MLKKSGPKPDRLLDGDENTIIAEIKSIKRDTDDPIIDPITIILYVTCPSDPATMPGCLGLDYPLSASYTIEGNKFTLWGDLILALTNNETNILIAEKQ